MSGDAIVISVAESSTEGKGEGIAATTIPIADATTKAIKHNKGGRRERGIATFDLILRVGGLAAAVVATIVMGTFEFPSHDDIAAFTYVYTINDFILIYFHICRVFFIANGIASVYLFLSLPFSIFNIVRPHAKGVRLLLLVFDTISVGLTAAGAAAAEAMVHVVQNGISTANPNRPNWIAIAEQLGSSERLIDAVVASFIATFIFMFLVVLAPFAIRKH
ncbi:hypothetical protein IFM89_027346 [Coptis chinensis]|uniref:CASP-like protein n=1 Tax=Coptis chinensis TaxID=261450 RepID=A0A835HHS0_9MAGN|nr:hypothetical protein IFM89_027346 [Coptis chinensis]